MNQFLKVRPAQPAPKPKFKRERTASVVCQVSYEVAKQVRLRSRQVCEFHGNDRAILFIQFNPTVKQPTRLDIMHVCAECRDLIKSNPDKYGARWADIMRDDLILREEAAASYGVD